MTTPLTHSRTFRVRFYECDAYGHLNNANYARYMQETAFDASAAAGYDLARYQAMQRHWLIRQSCVDYLRPLTYDDQVQVTTWVSDFRRASSRRQYEFRLLPGNEIVAQAYSDWVFLDTLHNLPATIPEELIRDFFPAGLPPESPSRQPYPKSPPRPDGAFETQRRVAWSDLDSVGHVNNAVYLNYLTECGFQALAACDWPFERLKKAGIGIFIRRLYIQYLQPAFLDDDLVINAWLSNVRRASALRHYTIQRANDLAAVGRAQTYSAWIDLQSGQPRRIPAQMLADMAPLIAEDIPGQAGAACPFRR
jgi:acyl-CoA thioester hydrolase